MNRFQNIFSGNKKALIVFDCAGAPDMDTSAQRIEEIIRSGADIVELGIPFSDPMADGAAIQKAYQTALQNGAESVLNIDASLPALHQAEKNYQLNGFKDKFDCRCGDAFEVLRQIAAARG